MRDVLLNLLASVLAGVAVWSAQRLLSYQRLARKRAFFGLDAGADCTLVVSRHASSPSEHSVHRRDVAALVELATIARDCGARADLVTEDDALLGIGRRTEFCVGGPSGNPRTAAHLRSFLHGVRIAPFETTGDELAITVGTTTYRRVRGPAEHLGPPGYAEYVVLAKAYGPAMAHPVFVIAGQTARTNQAAARFLADRYRELLRRHGTRTNFCLVLRILEPTTYGSDYVEVVADVTGEAFQPVTSGS